MMPKHNIVYIHSHDTGRYVQPYGHAIPTPNLQKFAEQGILFRQAFCANPTCSPSRAALVTGQCAHSSGMYGLAHRGFSLHNPERHIAKTLKKVGYTTALSGVQHVTCHTPEQLAAIGYDRVLATDNMLPKDAAVEFLDNAPEKPFFLAVGFCNTHRAFPEPGPNENPDYCLPPLPLPDTPETRQDIAAFKASARLLDEGMGTVFEALDRNGLTENTVVICTTDHGIAFPRMKCNLTDSGIGIMLIVRGPGGFTGGRVSDALVSHIDIFPTLCDLIGIEHPEWLQGQSLVPLINGNTDHIHDEIFAEVNYHASYEPMRCVRTKRWKYIRRYDERSSPILPNCDDSPSKTVWMDNGWRDMPPIQEAMYDLIFDPAESNNLINDPTKADVLSDLKTRLTLWMESTDDPILAGPVPPTEDAVVNDPDGISPQEETFKAKR